jgi:hypothetical protein
VEDTENQEIVRTLAGNGEAGFADRQGDASHLNHPKGPDVGQGLSILVADSDNHAVRQVTMSGAVSTVAGNGVQSASTKRSLG